VPFRPPPPPRRRDHSRTIRSPRTPVVPSEGTCGQDASFQPSARSPNYPGILTGGTCRRDPRRGDRAIRGACCRRPAGDGLFLLIVGPDGCRKSTLAPRLIEETRAHSRGTAHMHWCPGLLPRAGSLALAWRSLARAPAQRMERRTRIVGNFPTRDSLMRIVGRLPAVQDDE
jgi:hypothetical protein